MRKLKASERLTKIRGVRLTREEDKRFKKSLQLTERKPGDVLRELVRAWCDDNTTDGWAKEP